MRRAVELTPEFVFKCGESFLSQSEIGGLVGLSQAQVSRRLSREPLKSAYRQGRGNAMMSLRRAQLRSALEKGNTLMLIHLGKVYLGQSDRPRPAAEQAEDSRVRYVAVFGRGGQPTSAQEADGEGEAEEE